MAELTFTEDVAEADAAIRPFLHRDPARNNAALLPLARQANRPDPVARFWWSGRGQDITGVCVQVGAVRGVHVNLFDGDSDLARRFAVDVAERFPDVSGVDGPVGEASTSARIG